MIVAGSVTSVVGQFAVAVGLVFMGMVCKTVGQYCPSPGELIDVTVPIGPGLPVWESASGIHSDHRTMPQRISAGDVCNLSWLNISCHTGTHIDASSHFIQEAFERGEDVAKIPLRTLIGQVLVLDIPSDNPGISPEVLDTLEIDNSTERIIFKTANTRNNLMFTTAFDQHQVGLTVESANWLTEHLLNLTLVGIDYLSIAWYNDVPGVHKVLFNKQITVVEGLDLRTVQPGAYKLMCLPLALIGGDGAPARCILETLQTPCV